MELIATNLRRQFAQVIAISHQKDVLRYVDKQVVMSKGKAEVSEQNS
ncbi:MAG: hypothetical protein QW280_06460 [Candidatus Korarchaeum sp.]